MSNRIRIWQPWLLAIVLALGFTVTWVFVLALSSEFFDHGWGESKNAVLLPDETLAIHTYRRYGPDTYETLDGKPLKPPKVSPTGVCTTWWEDPPWNPATWGERIAVFSDYDNNYHWPVAYWYLVYDGRLDGIAYFVGYDAKNRQCLGYLGRNGFQRQAPSPEERFPIDGTRRLNGVFAGSSGSNYEVAYHFSSYSNSPNFRTSAPGYVVYLLSGNRLLRVNLRDKSIRVLRESEGMKTIQGVGNPRANLAKKSPQRRAYGPSMLALWTTTDMVFLDDEGRELRRWTIPESLRNKSITFYPMSETRAVAQWQQRFSRRPIERYHFVWFNDQGEVQKKTSVDLLQEHQWRNSPWFAAAAMPVPAVYTAGALIGTAVVYLRSGEAADWPGALNAAWEDTWPAIVSVALVGLAAAVVCYRRQRRYRQPWTWVWVITVFLFGVPGLIGYLFHRRWPAVEACPSCAAPAPRDREACCACGRDFPHPARKGTEVFA
ncbi:MAG TPA: hypothetical protein VJL29_01425 [Thermoguttaceae bacterium]|nr:hypothetical protein [Thermoguttaceae bacterium]